ncbi:MerR family transcriptional regulator [Leifsonia sp. C5G2]|uniref:MerR family transcriptional regulator n=1 Tax=Leifsonia sp. C5G2 TaxID=2735269 RepID=UPI00201C9C5D|nr:MerR family transcriptional regulator [Leifsonia sp. C5G2]
MMQIGEVAERTGLSHRTMRHYEEVGLVRPSGRSEGGFRLYTEDDVERLLLIRRMKPLDYSIESMKELLSTVDTLRRSPGDVAARAELDRFLSETLERRAKLARQLEMADEFSALLRSL